MDKDIGKQTLEYATKPIFPLNVYMWKQDAHSLLKIKDIVNQEKTANLNNLNLDTSLKSVVKIKSVNIVDQKIKKKETL